jgi:hypothetical protein
MPSYNLSDINGFTALVNGEQNDSVWYTVHKYSTKANETYSVVRYNKETLSADLVNTYGLLRSVILSGSNIVSFAPQKSVPAELFMTRYPLSDGANCCITAEQFIEGTMINVFFDPTYNCWQIATRNTVGADVTFYKDSVKTFNEMFMDACMCNNLNIQTLNPNCCYSFVLQHPLNRIVVPFKTPQLYLVAVYEILQTPDTVTVLEKNMAEVWLNGLWSQTSIKFPKVYSFTSYTELIERFASPNTPYDILGIVVKNLETGDRTKFRNPIYEEIRHLRGNQPKLQYQYLTLRHSGKLSEFLRYYPETKNEMSKFRDQVHMFTNALHKNYISCYVKKEKPLKEFSKQYRTHMYKIHQIFLNDLRPQSLFVTNTVVIKYVNELHPSLLMHCLNYNMRKRMVDTIKTDV